MDKKQGIAVVLLAVAAAAWILHKSDVLYVPGLSALSLCASMLIVGADMFKSGKTKRLAAILSLAMGVTMLLYGAFEIYIAVHS